MTLIYLNGVLLTAVDYTYDDTAKSVKFNFRVRWGSTIDVLSFSPVGVPVRKTVTLPKKDSDLYDAGEEISL